MSKTAIPATPPSQGFYRNLLVDIYVSDCGDITMCRRDRMNRVLSWSGTSKADAWREARIIGLAWHAIDANKR